MDASDIVIYVPDDGEPTPEQIAMVARLERIRDDPNGLDDAPRLAAGIRASVTLKLLAGDTGATYTPTRVAEIVSEAIDEQLARLQTN